MIKKILIALAVFVVAVLAFAATRPDSFRVERSEMIKAPPEKIFAYLSDFHNSTQWSPFEKTDPDMKRTFGGAEKGVGATYAWEGNSKAGKGSMELMQAVPPSKIVLKLDFEKPFKAENTVEYVIEPKDGGTQVTWAMYGPMQFVSKVMCLFVNMDKMVGGEFATGLANLKAILEK